MGSYNYVISTGVVVPDTAETRNEVIEEYRNIFGPDFITDAESPEGQLIDAETTSRQSVARNNAELANQINPDIAGGIFFDAIWALTRGQRSRGRRSQVDCTIAGNVGTIIPIGTQARTTTGALFRSVNTIVIPSGGSITGQAFESVEIGAIEADAMTLTQIVDSVLGWDTITNPAAATLGIATESDARARNTRRTQLAVASRSLPEAVRSRVSDVEGVRSLVFRENITDSTAVIDGITLVARSIWVAVEGGADNDVALALLNAKTAGANWNGSTSVTVTEPVSIQDYTVLFDRPAIVNVLVRVTIRNLSEVESPIAAVRQSILNYAAGNQEGEQGFIVGSDVSPFELASAVNHDNPQLFVSLAEVAVKMDNPTYQSTTLTIDLNQIARIEIDQDITVVIA